MRYLCKRDADYDYPDPGKFLNFLINFFEYFDMFDKITSHGYHIISYIHIIYIFILYKLYYICNCLSDDSQWNSPFFRLFISKFPLHWLTSLFKKLKAIGAILVRVIFMVLTPIYVTTIGRGDARSMPKNLTAIPNGRFWVNYVKKARVWIRYFHICSLNFHAVGMDSWVQTAVLSILREVEFIPTACEWRHFWENLLPS